jgi:hypothetical protein
MSVQAKQIVFPPVVRELGRLLQPSRFFRHPRDVVRDLSLTSSEKRAILSSWAANSCAIESRPALPGSGRVVCFDEVADALRDVAERTEDVEPGSRRTRRRRGGDPEDGAMGGSNWC